MLSGFANFWLVVTALAPIGIVYGVALLGEGRRDGWSYIIIALLLAIICWLLLKAVTRSGQREPLQIDKTKPVDKDALTFLVAYLLPLIVRKDQPGSLITLGVVVLLLTLVLLSAHILHVNPLMSLARYHFYEVITPSGATYLLITRDRNPKAAGTITTVRLSPHTYLEVSS